MVLSKSLLSKMLIVIATFESFELLAVDFPVDCIKPATTVCRILSCAAPAKSCCGSSIAADSGGADSRYSAGCSFFCRSHERMEGVARSVDFVDDDEDRWVRIKFDTLTSQVDRAYAMDVLVIFWIELMNNFTKMRIGRFISDVFSVNMPVCFSPELLPRARRIAWSYAIAFEMNWLVEEHLITHCLNLEIDAAVTAGRFTAEQAGYLKLMNAAYMAYVSSSGSVLAALRVLAQGDAGLFARMEEAFAARLRATSWGEQQHME